MQQQKMMLSRKYAVGVYLSCASIVILISIPALSGGVNSSEPLGAVRAVRQVRHERLQRQFFLLDKDARMRSGARGWKARKDLTAFDKTIAESTTLQEQSEEEISAESIQRETQEAIDMLAELQLQVEPARLAEIETKARRILSGLGFTDIITSKPVSSLSGGWKMRTALATCLLQESDILILDEPTNFLDLLGIIWLQRFLQSLEETADPPTLIIVSHDRDFISLCTDLLIVKDKQLTYFHGDLPTYEESQSERKIYLTKMKEAQDKQKAHIQQTIAQNIKQGKAKDDDNKLRQAKSRQKKLDDRWGLQVSAKGGRFKLNRDLVGYHLTARAEVDVPTNERQVSIVLPTPPDLRFPGALISLENASFYYAAKGKVKAASPALVLQDVSLSVHMGDRVGILGLNGAGKSTVIKLLVEEEKPTKGVIDRHPRLRLGYYSQHAVDALQDIARKEENITALALLTREVGGELDEGDLRSLLGSLGLPGRIASDIPIRKLSGGQVVRCELARILWRRPQCLILDEVTTHLDYETVTALREALRDWEGAVVLVSHDRWFVRGVVEGMLDYEPESDAESEDEDGSPRRRAMYRLKGGKLVQLHNGVDEFEELMHKRVTKLLHL